MDSNLRAENRMLKEQLEIIVNENKQLKDLLNKANDEVISYTNCCIDLQEKIDEAIEEIKTIKQHYEELKKAPFEDSVFITDMLRQSFILSIESYLDLFLEILGDKE